jgi:hypothetical protein
MCFMRVWVYACIYVYVRCVCMPVYEHDVGYVCMCVCVYFNCTDTCVHVGSMGAMKD